MKVSGIRAMLRNRSRREEIYSVAEYWDAKAMEYEDKSVSMWPNNHLNFYYHREQIGWLTKHLSDVANKKILDVGCGTGRLSRYFAERGGIVTGLDFSAKAIDVARRQSAGDNPSYRVTSVFALDEDGVADIIVVWGVLTVACKNEQELFNAMVKLRRALKPNGRIFLVEPIHKGFLHRVLNMNIGEFTAVMGKVGLKIDGIGQLHFWPMRLALCYLPWPKFITAPAYHVGQWIMGLLGNRALGDYKAICASPN